VVTAIVTCCKRLHNVEKIWEALRGQSQPCEGIWFFYNGKETLARGDLPPFGRILRGDDPDDHYTRFGVALAARTEYVFLLDDDCIPGARWVENCLRAARRRDGIFAPAGLRINRPDFASGPYTREDEVGVVRRARRRRTIEIDVPFHSFFLRRKHLAWMFQDRMGVGLREGRIVPTTAHEDVLLACRAWRRARVRCWLPSRPEPGMEGADQEVEDRVHANWVNRPHFSEERLWALRYEASLGWKPWVARGVPGLRRWKMHRHRARAEQRAQTARG
jgi:hypothetical protein